MDTSSSQSKKPLIIAAMVVLIVIVGSVLLKGSSAVSSAPVPAGWTTYTDSRFFVNYPDGFTVTKCDSHAATPCVAVGRQVIFASTTVATTYDQFAVNVLEDGSKTATSVISDFSKMDKKYVTVEKTPQQVDGMSATEVVLNFITQHVQLTHFIVQKGSILYDIVGMGHDAEFYSGASFKTFYQSFRTR